MDRKPQEEITFEMKQEVTERRMKSKHTGTDGEVTEERNKDRKIQRKIKLTTKTMKQRFSKKEETIRS